MNVQAVCDDNTQIHRWYDSLGGGWLIGADEYTLVLNPVNHGGQRYNHAISSAKNAVERTFGILINAFRCSDRSGRTLQSTPQMVSSIFTV